ncbi:MAG: capsule biosynthesis protein [Methylococcales bacterium]|nr:capsule biosynthesis protein [Methylococcales bacterium]
MYFGLIASDVYISESKFVLRGPVRQSESPISSLLKGSSFSSSDDDAFAVQTYILSRDALKVLNDKLAVGKAFSSSDVDIFSRFGGFGPWGNSFEELFKYYQKKIGVEVDETSGVSTLLVHAFTREDAYKINEELLALSEALVNKLNERGRQDLIVFAAGEVEIAEKKSQNAALALSVYRNQKNVIDPERQSTIQLQQIAKLQEELIASRGQLIQMQTFTKDNPQIPSMQLRVDKLQQEINAETNRVAGGDRSLAKKASEYERLALDREFADKLLSSTLASLELARNEAVRKQVYLERIVEPNLPDESLEPKRLRGILATFLLGMIAWGVLSVLLASVREHQD